jgi:hypothetical protein
MLADDDLPEVVSNVSNESCSHISPFFYSVCNLIWSQRTTITSGYETVNW